VRGGNQRHQQDHQPDLQEQMEMFNKLTSESSGSNELFQEDQSIKKSQKVSPSLSNVDKIDQVLAHGVHQTKKSVSSHTIPSRNVFNSTSPHLQTQKIVSNGVERSASSIPTIKSSIGPIGHESRMFGTDKIIRRMTNQERVYQTLAKGASNNSPQQQRRNTMINANMIHNVRNSTIGQIPRTKKNIVSQEPVHQPDTSPAQQKKNVVINSKIVGAVRNPTTEQMPRIKKHLVPTEHLDKNVISNNKNLIFPKRFSNFKENITGDSSKSTSNQLLRAKRQTEAGEVKLQGHNVGEIKSKFTSFIYKVQSGMRKIFSLTFLLKVYISHDFSTKNKSLKAQTRLQLTK